VAILSHVGLPLFIYQSFRMMMYFHIEMIEVNDIVQISPEVNHQGGFWAGNLLVVTEVKSWGVQGYCRTEGGEAYIRLKHGQFEKVGRLAWVAQEESE